MHCIQTCNAHYMYASTVVVSASMSGWTCSCDGPLNTRMLLPPLLGIFRFVLPCCAMCTTRVHHVMIRLFVRPIHQMSGPNVFLLSQMPLRCAIQCDAANFSTCIDATRIHSGCRCMSLPQRWISWLLVSSEIHHAITNSMVRL